MIEVLFKSEELLIAADSESKVVYGNTRKNSAVEYLNNLTPKNGGQLIILLATSKYVVAKQIKVTTKTEVVVKTAKSSMVKTAEDALADKFGLKAEVQRELDNGALEALREWDII